jgi:arsenite/tail-anchored protein-transporting ATPase
VRLRPRNLVGLDALRALAGGSEPRAAAISLQGDVETPPLSALIDEIEGVGTGLVMLMGKGGVGKTTIAAAIAVELAARGLPVHLSTTDPAAHVTATLSESVPGLRLSRIDPAAETEAYTQRVLATAGANLDAAGRALLEEDLRSPCTEEVAVFHAFSRLVSEARRGIVVLDTAPTGHTLMLLDATGAYHREVLRDTRVDADRITTPMMRLRDPKHTRVIIVTLPETTPVSEAEKLQHDLERAGIRPFAWIVNQSLAATQATDPLLRERAAAELPLLARVQELASLHAVIPLLAEAPIGPRHLRQLASGSPSTVTR